MILYALFNNTSNVTVTTSTRTLFAESYQNQNNLNLDTVIIKEVPLIYSSIMTTDGTIIKDEPALNYTIKSS